MNIKLTIQYDGTAYHGWQIQTNGNTIEAELKKAAERITGEEIKLIGCGRTDAGVHAQSYVCSFHTNSKIPPARLPYALNTYLPDDIVCKAASYAAEDFSANISAKGKRYVYRIYNSDIPDAFLGRYSWQYKYALDIEKMRLAANAFIGEHDFIGFASSGFTVKTTVRTIYSLDVRRENNLIEIDICGNGFLYNMVRIIAGTLVAVGSKRIAAEDMDAIIASKCRDRAGITAPAHGLCLKEVYY